MFHRKIILLFLFLNLFAPHSPYNSSRQFFGTFLSDSRYEKDVYVHWKQVIANDSGSFDEQWLTHLKEHYNAELLYVDSVLDRLKRKLQKGNLWDSTLLVVTSDHGECFGEHGLLQHWMGLYEQLVKIPLIIRYPACFPAGVIIDSPVSILDIFPTILEVTGIDPENFPRQAKSLLTSELSDQRVLMAEHYPNPQLFKAPGSATPELKKRYNLPLAQKYNRRWRMVRQGPMKLVFAEDYPSELYDLDKDPAEVHNLAEEPQMQQTRKELVHQLDECVRACLESHKPPERTSDALPPEVKDTMKALGYL